MDMNLNQIKTFLRWYSQRTPGTFGDWNWLTNKYLPAIKKLESNKNSDDRILISDSYYRIGDIFHFMNAPLESIKYYTLSIENDPDHSGAYREIGDRLLDIGKYKEAKEYLLKAKKLWPEDKYTTQSLKEVDEYQSDPSDIPLFKNGSLSWENNELLAQGKFAKVIKNLNLNSTIESLKLRARAYGGLNKKVEMIAEWERLPQTKDLIELESQDWFYMPSSVWNSSRFWLALSKLNGRFKHGNFPYHKSLYKSVIPVDKSKEHLELQLTNKRIWLFTQFQIARINNDKDLTNKLYQKYPKWPELEKLNKRLMSKI